MTFEDFSLPLAYEAAFFMQYLEDPSVSIDEIGEFALTAGQKLRSLAIMALVSKGDRLLFGQNLSRSGRVRLAYLRRIRGEGAEDEYHSASARIDGLVDAIAASDLVLGREIIGESRRSWLPGAEYEDDFCYAQLIHRLVLQEVDEPAISVLFKQYEKVL